MGLLDKLRGRDGSAVAPSVEAFSVHASELVEIVVESHQQDRLRRIKPTGSAPFLEDLSGFARKVAEREPNGRWFRAVLVREPDNEHDENVIAVHADGVGQVGYLSSYDAISYQGFFEALATHGISVASCPAFVIRGEPSKPTYSVMLCLSSPERIVRDLRRV
jgi:hypothetical protein